MKIARGNLERSLVTGFICHTTLPSSSSLEIFGKLPSLRLYCNDKKKNKPQKAISAKNTFFNGVKIGRKIYVFPKASTDQSPVSNIEKVEVSAKSLLEERGNILVDNHRSTIPQVSSKEAENYLKCDGREQKQSRDAEKDVSKFRQSKNVCKASSLLETQDKSKTITASQSSFVSFPLLTMPSQTVLSSILNFPLFNKLENKLFMPVEQQENLVSDCY